MFLIDIEGNGYSGRLKYLLWSHRPLLIVERNQHEYFFDYLEQWVHYIPVNNDLSDLITKINWCFQNYEKALIIAENAYNFSKKYLTREACYFQWNNIISKNNYKSEGYNTLTHKLNNYKAEGYNINKYYITSKYEYIVTDYIFDPNDQIYHIEFYFIGSNDAHILIGDVEIVFGAYSNTISLLRKGKQTVALYTINGNVCSIHKLTKIQLSINDSYIKASCNDAVFNIPKELFTEIKNTISIASWDSTIEWYF